MKTLQVFGDGELEEYWFSVPETETPESISAQFQAWCVQETVSDSSLHNFIHWAHDLKGYQYLDPDICLSLG